jgi:hypothetical protein
MNALANDPSIVWGAPEYVTGFFGSGYVMRGVAPGTGQYYALYDYTSNNSFASGGGGYQPSWDSAVRWAPSENGTLVSTMGSNGTFRFPGS